MRRLLWLIPILWCAQAFSQAVLVQSASNNASSGGGASVSVTVSSTGTGHLLLAFCINIQSASAACVVTSTNNTWSTAWSSATCATTQFGTAGCALAYTCNSVSGDTSVAASGAGFAAITIMFREYSGANTLSCLDLASAPLGSASGSPLSSNPITTTATDLLIGTATGAHVATLGVGSGWADFIGQVDTTASNLDAGLEDTLTSSAGSHTASFTTAPAAGAIGIAAFKLTGAASAPATTVFPKTTIFPKTTVL